MKMVNPESVIILLVIPQNRFCDEQLLELKSLLKVKICLCVFSLF